VNRAARVADSVIVFTDLGFDHPPWREGRNGADSYKRHGSIMCQG
jgi:hypothetical protein